MYTRQGPPVHRRQTPQGPATLRVHHLGPHPLIHHFLELIQFEAIARSCLGSAGQRVLDDAKTLCVLVHNVLVSPAPLYRIAEWVAPIDAAALDLTPEQQAALNDDRVARALDALGSARARNLWFRLALRIIKRFELRTDRMHFDTTTVTFHGTYAGSVTEPRIARGYNKDHRPDLKQLLFGITVTADGAVPVEHRIWSGNRTDDSVHQGNLERLRTLLGREDFIYVADSKLCTKDNLAEIASHSGKFVTVLPRTRREDQTFRQRLRQQPARWKTIAVIPNHRRESDPPDVFSSCAGPSRTEDGFRLVWIRSSHKADEDQWIREDRLGQAEQELVELGLKLNRGRLRKRAAIRNEARALLRRHGAERFLEVEVHRYQEFTTRYLRRGRPRPTDPVTRVVQVRWRLQVSRNRDALRREEHTDGVFPIVTNLTRESKAKVLLIYKYQPYVEKRFSHFKTDLEVAPVYLKKPKRAAALLDAYFVALMVDALIERQLRARMSAAGISDLPVLPEGRPSATPTTPRVLEVFSGVVWHEFERGQELVSFPVQLTPLQTQILDLLEVGKDAYR
jgi:transposase